MKRIIFFLLCLCTVASVWAQTPVQSRRKAVPPAPGGEGESVFVGNYEEVLTYPKGWTLRAGIADDNAEVLQFYPEDGPEVTNAEFQSYPNYTAKRLMSILVIPKRTGRKYRSLKQMCDSTGRQFKKDGVEYSMSPEPSWPTTDACRAIVTKPYAMLEVDSQSDTNIFVLNAGIIPEDRRYTQAVQTLLDGIRTEQTGSKKFSPKPDLFAIFKDPTIWATEILLCLLCGVLWVTGSRRARWCAASMFVYAHAAGLYQWSAGIACWLISKPFHLGTPAVPLFLAAPLISRAISKKMGGTRLWRVVLWALPLSMFFGLVVIVWSLPGPTEEGIQTHGIASSIVFFVQAVFVMYAVLGLSLGLTHGFPEQSRVEQKEDA